MIHKIGEALLASGAMAWQVGWSLVLGFVLSGLIQSVVSKERMREQLGRSGVREIALATGYGAASSSCSYAAAALSRTLFKKGAGLAPSLAFLFSSTNLVVELGIILYLLMGWQFTVAEWIGGVLLVAIMSLLVKVTYPKKLVEEARAHEETGGGHEHGSETVEGATLWQKLKNPRTPILVAQSVAMDWSMLWKDVIGGFLIAGFLAVFVPPHVWKTLFLSGAPAAVQIPANAIAGAVIAILTFVCSIGNVPMAAILWGTGISFGGVLAFLYADLIVLPLLDVYRKYYGWKMAAYIFVIFFATMVTSAMLMDVVFSALHQVPKPNTHMLAMVETFSFNYTFCLNVLAAIAVVWFAYLNRKHPMDMDERSRSRRDGGPRRASRQHARWYPRSPSSMRVRELPSPKRLAMVAVAVSRSFLELRAFQKLPDGRREVSLLPRRFVERLLALGPLYVKIGQILSTRPDLLPGRYVAELQRLQEHVPPMPLADVRKVLREEFHRNDVLEVFATFDETPIASASVAQVHFATLPSGEEVAVKVQRRGIVTSMTRDLAVLAVLLRTVALVAPKAARAFNLRDGFAEFRRYTLQELDFTVEAQTMTEFRRNFADWRDVVIPKPFEQYVSKGVLTMERVSGARVDRIVQRLSSQQRAALGRRLLEIEMKMFISDGLFHADLHPGNIFFKDDGTIVLLDFGMYGRLTDEHRDHFMLYWFYGLQKRTKSAFRHLIAQTRRLPGADEAGYFKRFSVLAERFYRSTISEYSLTQTYVQIIGAGAKYGFVFPSDLLLHAKALTTAEALAFVLTPDLRFEDEALPIIAREFVQRAADPARLRRRLADAIPELLLFGSVPPEQMLERDGDAAIAERLWSSVGAAAMKLERDYRPDVSTLRTLLDPTARPVLSQRFGADGSAVLDRIWSRARERWATLPRQSSLGPTITVRLAAVTAAAYETLVAEGVTSEHATRTVYDIAWAVYEKMGGAAWALSAVAGKDNADRMRIATVAFRTFPFSAPSYE